MGPAEELAEYDRKKCWPSVFQRLRIESMKKHDFSLKDSRRPEFRNRNRYGDVSPYDDSRVHLERNGIDYINASTVKAGLANRTYLLTQGPLPETSGHFWLMVWEQNSRVILMLNRVIEKDQIKCHKYYPTGQDNEGEDEMVFNDVGLKVSFVAERDSNYHYTARVLLLHDLESGETREVIQFHYTAWPDFGVPESPNAFLDFLFVVRESGALDDPTSLPIIHCSAGIGRSGTFCLVDTCLVLIERYRNMNDINVLELLMGMRRYRMGLIQTHDQLRFSYLAIVEGAKRLGFTSPDQPSSDNQTASNNNIGMPGSDDQSSSSRCSSDEEEYEDDSLSSPPDSPSPPPLPPRRPITSVTTSGPRVQETSRVISESDTTHRLPWDINGDIRESSTRLDKGVAEESPITNNGSSSVSSVLTQEVKRTNDNTLQEQQLLQPQQQQQQEVGGTQEIRRRRHDDRVKNTAEQIARMKQRQLECELRQKNRSQLTPYVIAGASAILAVSSYFIYRFFYV